MTLIAIPPYIEAQLDEHLWYGETDYDALLLRLIAVYDTVTPQVARTPERETPKQEALV